MLEYSLVFVNEEGTHASISLGACLHWGHRIKQEKKTVYGHAWSEWDGILKPGVSFLVTTNLKTRENALDNWCHSVACCDRDFGMCSGQWVSLHCQILPSSYWRLLKFRDEEIKQEDHKYLYTNEHHQAFQVGFWAPVPGVKPDRKSVV